MIELYNVTKDYPSGTHALHNVSIKIDKGEYVFVVGQSGAGKSTFLKLLMLEELATSGDIFVNNIELGRLKRKKVPFYRRTLGIVFQDFRLINSMSVFDNVAFPLRIAGVSKRAIRKRVPYVLNLVGLADKYDKMPTQMSGGEQQRVAFARAIVNNPAVIIADEPTGNIDPERSHEMFELLESINNYGITVITVTHAHDLVKKFNKRTIVLDSGRVISDSKYAV